MASAVGLHHVALRSTSISTKMEPAACLQQIGPIPKDPMDTEHAFSGQEESPWGLKELYVQCYVQGKKVDCSGGGHRGVVKANFKNCVKFLIFNCDCW